MRISRGAAVAVVVFLALVYSGCDSAPGVSEDTGTPPVVTNLEFSPKLVVFEHLDDDHVIGDSVAVIDLTLSASVRDDDGDIDSVKYLVNTPFDAFAPLTTGTLSRNGAGATYSGSARLEIPRGNSGLYTLIVYATDTQVSVSNQVRGQIEYQLEGGSAPVIVDVEGPEEITPPVNFAYTAVVEDPDGLGNIASVIATGPNGDTYDMYDDGQNGGDPIPGDGRYTVTFNAPEGTPAGTVQFRFQAFDRQGLSSDVVVRDLTVK